MPTGEWHFPFGDLPDEFNPIRKYGDDRIFDSLPEHHRVLFGVYDDRERRGEAAAEGVHENANKNAIEFALAEAELKDQLDTLEKFYIYKTLKEEGGEDVLFDHARRDLPELMSRDTYKSYNQAWIDRKLNNDLQDKISKMVMEKEFDDYLEFIRRNSKWESDIDIHINRAKELGRGFRRKRKTRKMRRRRRQVGNRRRSRVKRQSRKNLNKKLRRSAARRSKARHNRRRTRSKAHRSKARKNLR